MRKQEYACHQLDNPEFLLKLALSIGQSSDHEESCSDFLDVLVSDEVIHGAAIWLNNHYLNQGLEKDCYSLIKAIPQKYFATKDPINIKTPINEQDGLFVVSSFRYNQINTAVSVLKKHNLVSIYSDLDDIGILELIIPYDYQEQFEVFNFKYLPVLLQGLVESLNKNSFTTLVKTDSSPGTAGQIAESQPFEENAIQVITNFMGLSNLDIDKNITSTLEAVGINLGLDSCHLFQLTKDKSTVINTHFWSEKNGTSQLSIPRTISLEYTDDYLENLRKEDYLLLNLEQLAADSNPILQYFSLYLESGNLIIVPVVFKEIIKGFISFTADAKIKDTLLHNVNLFKTIAYVFFHALDRKETEKQLARYAGEIEAKNCEYVEAKLEAEEASRLKSEILANISHEIRTPLNVITGMTELALESEMKAEQRETLETVRTASDNLLRIINDVLDYSIMESGNITIESEAFNLHCLANELEEHFSIYADQKNIDLKLSIDKSVPPTIVNDRGRLKQALSNLIDNAIKFTEVGEVNLLIDCEGQDNECANIRFVVHDTGIGMSATQITKLYNTFYQADGSMSRKYSGTGLGLSITQKVIELMGGKLEVTSNENKGSTFTFSINSSLPAPDSTKPELLYNNDMDEDLTFAAPDNDHTGDLPTDKKEQGLNMPITILVVEDNPMNQKLIKAVLAKKSWPVKIAGSGKKALELLEIENFDLILMDVQMPTMDGYETTTRIRIMEREKTKKTPIIAVTAHALKEDREKCLKAGMDEYIQKPFNAQDLYRLIEKTVQEKKCSSKINADSHQPQAVARANNNFSTESDNDSPPADLDSMMAQLNGDLDLMTEVVEIFAQDAEEHAESLSKAFESSNTEEIAKIAHGFKGVLGSLGAKKAYNYAFELEKAAKEEKLNDIPELNQKLMDEIKRLINYFCD